MLRSGRSFGKDSPAIHWQSIIDGLNSLLVTLKENHVRNICRVFIGNCICAKILICYMKCPGSFSTHPEDILSNVLFHQRTTFQQVSLILVHLYIKTLHFGLSLTYTASLGFVLFLTAFFCGKSAVHLAMANL